MNTLKSLSDELPSFFVPREWIIKSPPEEQPPKMPKKPNDQEAVRLARVRQLFTSRHPGQADGNDVLIFYGWLHGHYAELLPKVKRGDDPYQQLKLDLHDFYRD